MLSVQEARDRLIARLETVGAEALPLEAASGRVLAEAIVSSVALPPFANSSMDGFAVRAADLDEADESRPVSLQVVGDIAAGRPASATLGRGQAMRIMTGAALPAGADTVVPVEKTSFGVRESGAQPPSQVEIYLAAGRGAYVRQKGEDLKPGQEVVAAGKRIGAPELGMLATLGRSQLLVYRAPKVALISTGDELLPVDAELEPGKIRESNSYALGALVESCGAKPLRYGIVPDKPDAIQTILDQAVAEGADLIISSAGVSVGAHDYVRPVVEKNGSLDFWRVNMRPGKPLAFGRYKDVPFVGLPGNPVSAFVGFEVFLRPGINRLGGDRFWQRFSMSAKLRAALQSDGRESYLRGVVSTEKGVTVVREPTHQGSGNLFSLVQANALFIVPAGVKKLEAGSTVSYWPL